MRCHAVTAAVAALALSSGVPVHAWSAKTRVRMADDAVRLLPPSLRTALEHHREDLLRGVLGPMTEEDGPTHRPPWDAGTVDQEIAARMAELTRSAARIRSFRDLALRFGTVAHFVADASFPPGASGAGADARYRSFGGFCESRLDRIPLVFYGHDDPSLATDDDRAFALAVLDSARLQDRDLARAYAQAGEHPDPAAFDDRSIPFAVASLSYSRSVTYIVRAWLAAWGRADGDLRQTPYLKSVRTYRRERDGP